MALLDDIRTILGDALGLGERAQELQADSALLGAIPEFDSMAVVSVITALEEQFELSIDDDEVSAETFETLGTIIEFVEGKRDRSNWLHYRCNWAHVPGPIETDRENEKQRSAPYDANVLSAAWRATDSPAT